GVRRRGPLRRGDIEEQQPRVQQRRYGRVAEAGEAPPAEQGKQAVRGGETAVERDPQGGAVGSRQRLDEQPAGAPEQPREDQREPVAEQRRRRAALFSRPRVRWLGGQLLASHSSWESPKTSDSVPAGLPGKSI